MYKVYISNKVTSDEDRRIAKALAAELEAMGYEAIYDAAKLDPSRDVPVARIRELADLDAVVALVTKNRSNSVMVESGMARAFEYVFGKMRLFVVKVGEMEIPKAVGNKYNFRMSLKPTSEEIHGVAVKLDREIRKQQVNPNIFISHRHSDKHVAQAIVKLLETEFEIQRHNLRCTSVDPYRLRAGEHLNERLRTELQHAEVVLGVISPDVKDFELCAVRTRGVLGPRRKDVSIAHSRRHERSRPGADWRLGHAFPN